MKPARGTSRVIIENVRPQVDGGTYVVKRTIGEGVEVRADIFGDGHDHIRARIMYKGPGDANWHYIEMTHTGNDEWNAFFQTPETGIYTFSVMAWVDHFDTWYDGFKKKVAANVQVELELQEGIQYLERLGEKSPELREEIKYLSDEYNNAIEYVLSQQFASIVHAHPLIEFPSYYGADIQVSVEFAKARFSTWYELFPRSASLEHRHGTFQDVIHLLPRIAQMGFDVLYLPPIHPIGKMNRKGKNNSVTALEGEPGSPWAIGNDEGGHKSIHPQLGTLEDFKQLMQEAGKLDIDIAMDIAFQCAPDHPYVESNPEWFRIRPDGSIQYAENPPKKYQDIYPFNFESNKWEQLWEELKSVFFYWIEQGVHIFRVDNPHTKPIAFWQWVIEEINKKHRDVIFLSEAFTKPKVMASLAKVGFTQSYTYFTWRNSKQELTEYMTELMNEPSRNFFRPNFWPNTPDILPYHLQYQGENIFIIRFALAATLSSNYGMYGPVYEFYDNVPVEGKEEYYNSEKYEVKHHDWKRTTRMTDIIAIVNRARKENLALQFTFNLTFCPVDNPNLLAYFKVDPTGNSMIMVIVNLDAHQTQQGYVRLPLEKMSFPHGVRVYAHDLMTDEHYTWTHEWNFVELNPYKMPFHLLKLTVDQAP